MLQDTRPWPLFWDFKTRPPSMIPVDIFAANPAELAEIAHAYPDPCIAHLARQRLTLPPSHEAFWYDVDWYSDDDDFDND